jgi:hypothetical protein
VIPLPLHQDDERRHFFRFKDELVFTYRRLAPEATPDFLKSFAASADDPFTLAATLAGISQETHTLNRQLQTEAPLAARYFSALERKIDLLAQAIFKGTSTDDQDTQEVDLSGSGVSFDSMESLTPGDLLELRLVLFPSYTGILASGRVIRCEKTGSRACPYKIAVEFVHIRDTDRQCIVKHILDRQATQIRQTRQGS